MDRLYLLHYVDYTLLNAVANWEDKDIMRRSN